MKIINGLPYIDQVKALILAYTKELGRDLSFQNIQEELLDPSRKYTPPQGELLVVIEADTVLGMVAYHRHNQQRCEMKRLYVLPQARGKKLGEALVQAILDHARQSGYQEMVLDTIRPLKAAIALYKKYGFQCCDAYYDNPMKDVIYLKRSLT